MLVEDQIKKEYGSIEESFRFYRDLSNEEITKLLREYDEKRAKILNVDQLTMYPSVKTFNHARKMLYGGKRYRYIICVFSCLMMAGLDSLNLIKRIANWTELYHIYTLDLDDWEDEDEERRGLKSHWKAALSLYPWPDANEPSDIFKTKALRWAVKSATHDALRLRDLAELAVQGETNVDKSIREKVLEYLTQTDMFLVDGQDEDIDLERMEQVQEEQYEWMIDLKSGLLFRASAKTGGAVGGATSVQLKALDAFALHFNRAFQRRDDMIGAGVLGKDLEESVKIAKKMEKSASSDLEKGKKTELYIIAKNNASPSQLSILEEYHGKVTAQDTKKINAIRKVYFDTGAVNKVKQKIRENAEKVISFLEVKDFQEEPRKMLTNLAKIQLVRRK